MSQPDVTGAGGPAEPPSPQAGDAGGAPGRPPGADAPEGTRRPYPAAC